MRPSYCLLLAYWLFNQEHSRNLPRIFSYSQKWHDSLNRKWMRPRNVGAARAALTSEDSEWNWKFEELWQSRLWDWRGVRQFFPPRPRQKACQVPSTLQGTAGWRCSEVAQTSILLAHSTSIGALFILDRCFCINLVQATWDLVAKPFPW